MRLITLQLMQPGDNEFQLSIKLCPMEAETCVLPMFCNCDLEFNPHDLET